MLKLKFKLLIFLFLLSLTGCTPSVEPINYGKDSCHHCKMLIIDQKWGTEIVSNKGKVFKFDDINCLVLYLKSNEELKKNAAHIMVSDYDEPGNLIDARHAWYVQSESLRSPMAGSIASFSSNEKAQLFLTKAGGIAMNWEEVYNYFK